MRFTKIKMDSNGNSRVVVHFLELADTYQEAIKLSHKIGGRKFHNKQYGGGIVFQLTTEAELEKAIERVRNKPTRTEAEPSSIIDVETFAKGVDTLYGQDAQE